MTITLTETQFMAYVKCAIFCFEAHNINDTYSFEENEKRSAALKVLCEVYDDIDFSEIPALSALKNGEHRSIEI